MAVLLISSATIVFLGTTWWFLTHQRRKLRRVWSWQRIRVRTLDFFVADVSGQKLLPVILLLPFLPQLIGHGRSFVGLCLSILVTVSFAILIMRRAAK